MAIKVIYHSPCQDGWGAAFSAWNVFKEDAEYIPMNYGQEDRLPHFSEDDEVYLVDFSLDMEIMLDLYRNLNYFEVIDHHKTVFEDRDAYLRENPDDRAELEDFLSLDNDHSGAVLTWMYLNDLDYRDVPMLLKYIEDRDLWKWELNHSEEINMALQSYEKDFFVWSRLLYETVFEDKLWDLVEEGHKLLEHQRKAVDDICENAQVKNFLGYQVPVVRSKNFQSEVGHKLCQDYPFAVIHFTTDEGYEKYSMRSDGNFDVSELAKSMGGGGHLPAAGFIIKDGSDPTQMMRKYGEE